MSMGSPEGVLWEVLRMLQGPCEPEPRLSAEHGVGPFPAVSAGVLFSHSFHSPVKVQGSKHTEELTQRPRPPLCLPGIEMLRWDSLGRARWLRASNLLSVQPSAGS